jgi:hypothetical protein
MHIRMNLGSRRGMIILLLEVDMVITSIIALMCLLALQVKGMVDRVWSMVMATRVKRPFKMLLSG